MDDELIAQTGDAEAPPEVDPAKLLEDQKRRNAGLQRKLRTEMTQRQQLEQRLRQVEEALLTQSLAGLPPEERAVRMAAYQNEVRSRQLAEEEAALEERAKLAMIAELTARYEGISPDELSIYDKPQEMLAFVKRFGVERARDTNSDRFERGEAAPAPARRARNLDEAAELFRQAARRRGLA